MCFLLIFLILVVFLFVNISIIKIILVDEYMIEVDFEKYVIDLCSYK